MEDWSDWLQRVGERVIGDYSNSRWVMPYQIEQARLQALGQLGYYKEGQPGVNVPAQGLAVNSTTVLLLAGVAVVAVLLLKD